MKVNLIPTVIISALVSASLALAVAHIRLSRTPITDPVPVTAPPEAAGPSGSASPAAPGAAAGAQARAAPAAVTPDAERGEPWWAALVGKLAWPGAVIAALVLIGFNNRLRGIFGASSKIVRKISAGGVEMEISSEAVDQVRQQLKGSFRELVANARDEYERMADLQKVEQHVQAVLGQAILKPYENAAGLRATIHVPDIIFKDYLYQLIDYYPRGEGAHRRFSQRYGIIGHSWRSRKSHGTGHAFAAASSESDLVAQWGMTREEARGKLKEKPSCLSVLLQSGNVQVGVLYIDSDSENAFGPDPQDLVEKLQKANVVKALVVAVEKTLAPLQAAAPNLDIKSLG